MGQLGRPRKTVIEPEINNPRTIAYLRVSTDGQDLDKNRADILDLANKKGLLGTVEFVEEKISGKTPWRERKIGTEIIPILKRGDNVIVSELSRLGRSMLEIMEILSILKTTGVNVYAVKGDWSLNGMQSEMMAMVFAIAAEVEHDLIRSRTKEALRALKAKGIKLGRPKGIGKSRLDQYQPEIVALLRNGSRQCYVAQRYGVTAGTLIHYIKRHKLNVEPIFPDKGGKK